MLVVGLGIGLYLFGSWLTAAGTATGWVGYAPLRRIGSYPTVGAFEWRPWEALVVWLVLTAVWVAISMWLLRRRGSASRGLDDHRDA